MSVIIVEGFDTYNGTGPTNGLGSRWLYVPGATQMTGGRFGGQALFHRYDAGGTGGGPRLPFPVTVDGGKGLSAGFAFNGVAFGGYNPASGGMFGFLNSVTGQFHFTLRVADNGSIEVFRQPYQESGGVSVGISQPLTIKPGTWHYIEVETVISATNGFVKIYVDGGKVLDISGANTMAGTDPAVDALCVGAFGRGGSYFYNLCHDDLYVTDTPFRLGERKVQVLVPSSDVVKAFTPSSGSTNYTQVDELPNNGDDDYVQGSNVGDADLYGFTGIDTNPQHIDALQFVSYVRKTDAATRGISIQVKSGSTVTEDASTFLNASYARKAKLLTTDPNTEGAWSKAAVNAIQAGPKVTV